MEVQELIRLHPLDMVTMQERVDFLPRLGEFILDGFQRHLMPKPYPARKKRYIVSNAGSESESEPELEPEPAADPEPVLPMPPSAAPLEKPSRWRRKLPKLFTSKLLSSKSPKVEKPSIEYTLDLLS